VRTLGSVSGGRVAKFTFVADDPGTFRIVVGAKSDANDPGETLVVTVLKPARPAGGRTLGTVTGTLIILPPAVFATTLLIARTRRRFARRSNS
jgi:hypothetical protein